EQAPSMTPSYKPTSTNGSATIEDTKCAQGHASRFHSGRCQNFMASQFSRSCWCSSVLACRFTPAPMSLMGQAKGKCRSTSTREPREWPSIRGCTASFSRRSITRGDGGRHAELVQNRDFEAQNVPAGDRFDGNALVTPKGWVERVWFNTDVHAWETVAEGGTRGSICLVDETPLNPDNPDSMRLVAR